jgi:hypothetical protein
MPQIVLMLFVVQNPCERDSLSVVYTLIIKFTSVLSKMSEYEDCARGALKIRGDSGIKK